MPTLSEVLVKMVDVDEISMALVTGRDGFVIEFAGGEGSVAEGLGAIASSSLGASEVIGEELGYGTLQSTMLEFDEGTVIINTVGADAVLMVVLEPKATLGKVRHDVKRALPELAEAL